LRQGKRSGLVNGHEEIEPAYFGTKLCDVDMETANGMSFELVPHWLVALRIRQPKYAAPLQTAIHIRPRQIWNRPCKA